MILKIIDWFLAHRGFKRVVHGSMFDWVPPSVQGLTAEALPLVESEEKKTEQGGEYKRHQVYASMLKRHPKVNKQDIGWAIERAVAQMRKV